MRNFNAAELDHRHAAGFHGVLMPTLAVALRIAHVAVALSVACTVSVGVGNPCVRPGRSNRRAFRLALFDSSTQCLTVHEFGSTFVICATTGPSRLVGPSRVIPCGICLHWCETCLLSAIWRGTPGTEAATSLTVIAPNPFAARTVASSSGGHAGKTQTCCGDNFDCSHHGGLTLNRNAHKTKRNK